MKQPWSVAGISALPLAFTWVLTGACIGSAHAAPITPFNDALLVWHSPDVAAPAFFDLQRTRELQTGGGALAAASSTYSGSGAWGSVSGLAAADLAAGTLKTRATVDFVAPPNAALYMQSNAKFGDGFRTTTGSGTPFNWLPGSGARFSMHLDGSMTSTQPLESLNGGAFLILSLFQPGTLDPNQNVVAGANLIKSYAYFLGNPNQNLQSCSNGVCVSIVPEATFTDFSHGVDISQNITPGSDFDWQVVLGSAAWLFNPGSYDFDFSHTLTVGYQGPAGALTQSVSGLFGNIGDPLSVPEPGSLILALAGLFAMRSGVRRNERDGSGL